MSRKYWLPLYGGIQINSSIRLISVILITLLSGAIIPLWLTLPLLTFVCLLPTIDSSNDFNAIKYGDLSYGIYLIHFPLIKLIQNNSNAFNVPVAILPYLDLTLSAFGASFLYWYVER